MRWGERVEASRWGQVLISAFVLVVAGCVLLWNLPPGRPRDAVRPAVGTVVQGLGLEQDWALFAPDPRGFGVGVSAAVTHRDGRVTTWTPPHNGTFLSPYRNYRWQKYVERLRADDYAVLWEPTARWIARESGDDVTRVALTRTFRDVRAPGDPNPRPRQGSFEFYVLDLP